MRSLSSSSCLRLYHTIGRIFVVHSLAHFGIELGIECACWHVRKLRIAMESHLARPFRFRRVWSFSLCHFFNLFGVNYFAKREQKRLWFVNSSNKVRAVVIVLPTSSFDALHLRASQTCAQLNMQVLMESIITRHFQVTGERVFNWCWQLKSM